MCSSGDPPRILEWRRMIKPTTLMQLFVEKELTTGIEQGDCDGTEMIIWRVSN